MVATRASLSARSLPVAQQLQATRSGQNRPTSTTTNASAAQVVPEALVAPGAKPACGAAIRRGRWRGSRHRPYIGREAHYRCIRASIGIALWFKRGSIAATAGRVHFDGISLFEKYTISPA